MMKYVIIEDEYPAARRLERLVEEVEPEWVMASHLDSVRSAIHWFRENEKPDLVFMDIHLGDGLSFEILDEVVDSPPIIFTTAYEQYALKAFESNSVDYLLKPVKPEELERALGKMDHWTKGDLQVQQLIGELKSSLEKPAGKSRFLCYLGDQMYFVNAGDIAFFISEDGVTILVTREGKRFIVKDKLETVTEQVNENDFFRINRQMLITPESIQKISPYFNGRLKLQLKPDPRTDVIVSREKVKLFKAWLGE